MREKTRLLSSAEFLKNVIFVCDKMHSDLLALMQNTLLILHCKKTSSEKRKKKAKQANSPSVKKEKVNVIGMHLVCPKDLIYQTNKRINYEVALSVQ